MAADRPRKRPDLVVPSHMDLFYQEYKTWIIGACASLVVVMALFFLGKWYMQRKEAHSTAQYVAVISHLRSVWDRASLEKTASLLETLADRDLAPIGFLDLGNLEYYRGDPKAAERAYRVFISKSSADDPLLPLALEGLGYSLEVQGRTEEAFEYFLNASKETKRPGRTVLFSLARLSEKLGRINDAKIYYREFIQLYPGQDVLAAIAKTKLRALGRGAKP